MDSERLLSDVRGITASIAARAERTEDARRLPADLSAELKAIGVYRMYAPRRYGGCELDIPSSLPIIEQLSMADGSVGWTAMVCAHAAIYAAYLPESVLDSIYRDGPDVVWANSLRVEGAAVPASGGFRITGQWSLVSGCADADWMIALCAMTKGYAPAVAAVALPASNWRIADTWRSSGLRGSGSDDIVLDEVFAPRAQVFDLLGGEPSIDGPLYLSPIVAGLMPLAAVAIGIAQGALGDLAALAPDGSPVPLFRSEVSRHQHGRALAEVSAARAHMDATANRLWTLAQIGPIDEAASIEAGRAATWIAETCARAVDVCFSLAGTAGLYDRSPVQRRLRDIRAILLHRAVSAANYSAQTPIVPGKVPASVRN